jgi:hypothetical protein
MVIFPIFAAILAFLCCGFVLRDYIARPKPAGLAWTIAFAVFGAAALAEAIGDIVGWSLILARVYYVLGATLVVGYLAVGELYLLMRREWADKAAALMIALTAFGVGLVWQSQAGPNLADDGWEALQRGAALTALTIAINSVGTLVLVGGLLYSVAMFKRKGIMRNRMIGCLLIAAGTLAVAMGGTLTRLGSREFLYIAMSVGIVLIFAGYMRTRKPDIKRLRLACSARTRSRVRAIRAAQVVPEPVTSQGPA